MGFFDTIIDTSEELENHVGQKGNDPETGTKIFHKPKYSVSTPMVPSDRKSPAKAEKLSFLRPCSLCSGRNFVLGSQNGFFCAACHPGISGQLVEATGPDREKTDLKLDCQTIGGIDATHGRRGTLQITTQARENFMAAWPWIKERMPELLAGGWSRAALLRRGRFRHPSGNWGVAWLSVWKQPSLLVTIGHNGSIIFHFLSNGRNIRQTSKPPVQ